MISRCASPTPYPDIFAPDVLPATDALTIADLLINNVIVTSLPTTVIDTDEIRA